MSTLAPNFHDATGSLVLIYGCTGYKSRAAGTKNADFAIGVDGSDGSQYGYSIFTFCSSLYLSFFYSVA